MIEAVVQTGSFETAYRRAGCGGAVLLLGCDGGPADEWLFEQLSSRFRTVAPVRPAGVGPGASFETLALWLRGLIDGLGLQRPALVAGAADGAALIRFAAVDPHRVDRVALLNPGDAGAEAVPDTGAPRAGEPAVLRLGVPEAGNAAGRANAMARLVAFLEGSPAQAMTGSRSVS